MFDSGVFLVHVLYCRSYYESLWNIVKIGGEFSSSGVACWTVTENCRDFHLTLSTSGREGGRHRAVLEDKSGDEERTGPSAEDKKWGKDGNLMEKGNLQTRFFVDCRASFRRMPDVRKLPRNCQLSVRNLRRFSLSTGYFGAVRQIIGS